MAEENSSSAKIDSKEVTSGTNFRPRIFNISDLHYKVLCQADRKNYDPTQGLENLIAMYLSLAGPIDFEKLDLERAKLKAKKMFSWDQDQSSHS